MIRFIMLIYFLLTVEIIYTAAEVYNGPVFEQSEPNSSQHIWHSYTFNTGAGNREELYFSNAQLNSDFDSVDGVFVWKSMPVQEQVVIAGLGNDFIMVTVLDEGNNSVAYKEEIQGGGKALAMFQKWNVTHQVIENFMVVATCAPENNCILKWYKILDNKLKFLWEWPLRGIVTNLDVVKINYELKLLVISHKASSFKNPSAEFYSFDMNADLDMWQFGKIKLDAVPSSVTVFDNNDNIFLCASFPSLEMIHIFKYSKFACLETFEKRNFVSHRKIFNTGLKSLTSFRVGFRWYLAVAGNTSQIYGIKEDLSFQPLNAPTLGSFNNWLAVPVDTYREDTILLADSDSDVSVLSLNGDEDLKVLGSFTELACGNDAYCLENMKKVDLNESTAFGYHSRQNVIISTKSGRSLFFKLLLKLKPLPDEVTLKLYEIKKMKNALEKSYADQNEQISRLLSEDLSRAEANSLDHEQPVSQKKLESEILSDLDVLNATVEELMGDITKFSSDLKSVFPLKDGQNGLLTQNNTTDGITFYGDVLISELNLSNLNGHSVQELFADTFRFVRIGWGEAVKLRDTLYYHASSTFTTHPISTPTAPVNLKVSLHRPTCTRIASTFRKNKVNKISGKKTLKNLYAENIIFEKLGDIPACDILFSDDPWEDMDRNIINGDVVWDGKLNVLKDVEIRDPHRKDGRSATLRGTGKHFYDTLNFAELEVKGDTLIQETINGQLFIPPVYSGQLDVLDVVHQARVEEINVERNLNVGFINGMNFSEFVENLVFTSAMNRPLDAVKIEGVFSAGALETNHFNGIDLSEGGLAEDEPGRRLLDDDRNFYVVESESKRARNENLKRVIHVFQNLEVDGMVFTKKINNVSWEFLNDVVKKNEKTVTLNATKKFEGVLTAKKTNLGGTINGRFVDNVLTNNSNQDIKFPQIFDRVVFKNLTLEGAWDGVPADELEKSLGRLSGRSEAGNLTFEGACFVNVLKVLDSVNDVRFKNSAGEVLNNKSNFESIRASNIILHGSLITNNNINDMSLKNFSLMRVSLKSPETIEQDLFHPNLTLFGDLNLETINLNEVSSIINSAGDIKLIERILNGDVHKIKKLMVKGNITTTRGVNGHNVAEILEKGVCITKPGSIKGNLTFENLVYFDNVNVTGTVDGFSLKDLEKDIAFRQSRVYLDGRKNFSTVKVTKSMKAKILNGHLVQEIFTLDGDGRMMGPVQVNGDVVIKGNVTTYAAINNQTVPDLLKTFSTRANSFIYSGDLNLRNDHVTIKNLIVDGRIQNVSLDALLGDAVLKKNGVNVSGKKTFEGEVKFKQNVLVKGLVQGVNFSNLYSDIIFTNKAANLEGTVTIRESVLKVLETTGYFNSTLINNFDTNEWLDDSVPLNRPEVVSGRKFFENVHVTGNASADFINDHLSSAVITLNDKQYIPAMALFPRIHTESDLSVSGLVNGENLNDEYQDTVMVTGDQTIKGQTVFNNEFVVNGTLFVKTIKGKSVDSLITLDTEQVIRTPLEFKGTVKARKGIDDLKFINNISLREWKENSVLLDGEQVLKGFWTVKGKVKAKNVDGEGLLQDVSLRNVSKDHQRARLMMLEVKNETETEFSEQCRKLEELSTKLSKLPYLLYQFDIASEIETASVIDSVITFRINSEYHLIVTFVNECMSALYKWNKDAGAFSYIRQMNIGSVSRWSVIYRQNATYLVTSSLKTGENCEENLLQGNVWVFKGDADKYTHLLTTNAFVDVTHENDTSPEFYTIDENGTLQQWTLETDGNITTKFLLNVGQGDHRFIDFRIMGGLAISNGRDIKRITLTAEKVLENNISFPNSHILALPVEGKTLTAVVVKDKIVVYENLLEEKVFSIIHTHRAGSVLWLNYGPGKQAFLIVASHHKLIEVFEYKGASGLVKTTSIQMFSSRLQSETLPAKENQFNKHVVVIQKKKLIFLRADMVGDVLEKNDSLC